MRKNLITPHDVKWMEEQSKQIDKVMSSFDKEKERIEKCEDKKGTIR